MSRKVNWKAFLHKQKTFGKHFSKCDMVTLWHILPLKADPLSGTCGNYQVCWKGPRAGRKVCVVNGGGPESALARQNPCWNTLYQSFSSGPHLTHPKLESTYACSPIFSSSPNNTQATLESSLIPSSSLSPTTTAFLRVRSRQSLS